LKTGSWLTVLLAVCVGGASSLVGADAHAEPAHHGSASMRMAAAAVHAHKRRHHRHVRVPVFSGRLASASELRDAPLDRPSGHLEMYAVNFQERVDVELYRKDGSFDPDALDELNHLFRCRRTDTEKSINPRLFVTLSRIYDHFGKRIELVSGFRNQERTSSFHFHGSASDIRIPGVSDKALHAYVESLDTGGMGIGIYPRAGFIHVDIRPEPSYRWTDNSPPGTSDMGHPHKHRKHVRPNA
jgi:uncharacterized protein YcbK (DUF882 family)